MKTTSLLVVAAFLVLGHSAHADTLSLTIYQPAQSASAPGILSYTGIIANMAGSASVYLNGDAFTLDGPYVLDDTPLLDAPQILAPGQSYNGVLFDVPISDPLSEGTFDGNFTLLGGPDPSSQDALATEPFSVAVSAVSPAAVTPEPSSWVLLCTGAAVLGWCGLAGQNRRTRQPSCCRRAGGAA